LATEQLVTSVVTDQLVTSSVTEQLVASLVIDQFVTHNLKILCHINYERSLCPMWSLTSW
jgi:hypothetical protein